MLCALPGDLGGEIKVEDLAWNHEAAQLLSRFWCILATDNGRSG